MSKVIKYLSLLMILFSGLLIFIGCSSKEVVNEQQQAVQEKVAAKPYYEGKTIKVIVPYAPGGTYDSLARLLSQYMPKHLPGNPTMIVENQAGGGGMIGTASVYNAEPDGLTLGHTPTVVVLKQLYGLEKNMDFKNFRVIGSAGGVTHALLTKKEISLTDMEKGNEPVKIGLLSLGTSIDESFLIAKKSLGLDNINLVAGYGGQSELYLALKQNEIEGTIVPLMGYSQNEVFREMYDSGTAHLALIVGGQKPPENFNSLIEGVPQLKDLIKNDQDLKLYNAYTNMLKASRPFFTTPGTPDEVVDILRKAFSDTMADQEFMQNAVKLGFPISPLFGEEAQQAFVGILDLPENVKNLLKETFKE